MLNIAIFMPYAALYSNTKMLCFTTNLARKGVSIDLFTLGRAQYEAAPVSKLHGNIHVIDLGECGGFRRGERKKLDDFMPPASLPLVEAKAMIRFYDYCIGVDSGGLLFAHYLHEKTGCPFAYLSQKLYRVGYPGVWTDQEIARLKDFERKLLPLADMVLIQDFQREESFFENLGIDKHPNIMHFPASVMDFNLPAETRYWHEKFKLPAETRIILSIGQFNRHNIKDELIQATMELPDNQVLVLHGRFAEPLMASLAPAIDSGRVFLSTEMVDWRTVPLLVASADIGLACYYEFNINQYLAARASTTIAYFAKCGIPMILPNFTVFREVVEQYRHGVLLSYPQELPAASRCVVGNYLRLSSGARDAYESLYNVDIYGEQLWEYIRDMKNNRLGNRLPPPEKAAKNSDPIVPDAPRPDQYSVASLLRGLPTLSNN